MSQSLSCTVAPRGGRTGGWTGRGGRRTRESTGRVGGRTGDQDGQAGNRGNHASNIQGDVRSANVSNGRNGCSYKEFMTCNPKDYDGKGGAIVYTRWIEKMESVQDMSGCGANLKVKYTFGSFIDFKGLMRKEFYLNNELQKLESEFWCHTMVRAGHVADTDRLHKPAGLVPHLVTPEKKRIERNGSLRKNTKKRGNGGELSRDGNVTDDNKRSRTSGAFAIVTNPVKKEYMGTTPKVGPMMVTPLNVRNPKTARGACFESSGTDHYKATCPRLNRAPRQGGNRQNQTMAIEGGQGRGNNGNQARRGAFMMGAKEARQDPNIVTGTFTLNNHYVKTLFDSGADYSFVSTTFIPLLDIEPSDLGFSYDIEIASRQLVEINKAEIICHEKVVRISLPCGEILRVLGEKPEEKVFPDSLSGLPPSQEFEFRIDITSGAMRVAKSPYRLAPSKMEELSSQLREL
ncbi:putative reverse transcriptase domain-containing protein [Tanacetum coccineum]